MNSFEKIILEVDQAISIKKQDRQVYNQDFDMIRNHLLNLMKLESTVFEKIYNGPSLFGSVLDNAKINTPDEYDVHFVLKLPFYEDLILRHDYERPGYIKIDLSKVLPRMRADPNWKIVYDIFIKFVDENMMLCRNRIQGWLAKLIRASLCKHGNTLENATGVKYTLLYSKRGTAHTIRAVSSVRKLSIDFVPAFKFEVQNEWLADRKFPKHISDRIWFAVPKPTVGPKKGRRLTFSICAPQVEKHLLKNKCNLKSSFRLFKSLRDKTGELFLKSYFIKSLYLYENDLQDDSFWQNSAAYLLIHMIGVLVKHLEKNHLPFYWSESMNLLRGLKPDQVNRIKEKFVKIKELLDSYYNSKTEISKKSVFRLFSIGEMYLSNECS